MPINDLLLKYNRIFIIPLDHPAGTDTPQLNLLGKQNFVDLVDHLGHDGYIFHAREYIKHPIKTDKDFFLTAGEMPENYLCDISDIKKNPDIQNITVFFEVENETDDRPYEFYKDYIKELKDNGYFVMIMGYPKHKIEDSRVYQHIIDLAYRLDCDAVKTDLIYNMESLDLKGMYLFIAGGPCMDDSSFNRFLQATEKLKTASCSFGRNIFESKNYKERIGSVLKTLDRTGN